MQFFSGHLASQLAFVFLGAFVLCAGLIKFALPLAARLAIAIPNARSSHKVPTPQSGGLFLSATIILLGAVIAIAWPDMQTSIIVVLITITLLAMMGWCDDRWGLPVWFRLLCYTSVSLAYAIYQDHSFLGLVNSPWLGHVLAAFFVLSMINVTNFMDGIDGMVVAEFVPMLVMLVVLAALGRFGPLSGFLAASLAGALLGFFVFNRPVARIFLGDSGSLVVGFLSAVLLLEFARDYGAALAVILPLYFLTDAGLTLARRILRGERFWIAHREHFYQRAIDSGQSNWSIIGWVAVCNVGLSALAFGAVTQAPMREWPVIIVSPLIVAFLMMFLLRSRRLAQGKEFGE